MLPITQQLQVIADPAFKNREKNPYNWLLYRNLQNQGVAITEFSPLALCFGSYDIWHMHWPEIPINHPQPLKMLMKLALFWGYVTIAQLKGIKLIWTVHNLQSHEQRYPKLEAKFWQYLTNRLDGYLSLSHSGLQASKERFPALSKVKGFVIPHNHYRHEYPNTLTKDEARQALDVPKEAQVMLLFGRLRTYKNVEHLVQVFRDLPQSNIILNIVGQPDRDLQKSIVDQSLQDSRIRIELNFISRDRAQLYFRAADLVVLPYREILNSGSALLALSFDCPVLLPNKGAMAELKNAIGSDWIYTYDGDLTVEHLQAALTWAVETPRSSSAPLDFYEPEPLAAQTLAAYRQVALKEHQSSGIGIKLNSPF